MIILEIDFNLMKISTLHHSCSIDEQCLHGFHCKLFMIKKRNPKKKLFTKKICCVPFLLKQKNGNDNDFIEIGRLVDQLGGYPIFYDCDITFFIYSINIVLIFKVSRRSKGWSFFVHAAITALKLPLVLSVSRRT